MDYRQLQNYLVWNPIMDFKSIDNRLISSNATINHKHWNTISEQEDPLLFISFWHCYWGRFKYGKKYDKKNTEYDDIPAVAQNPIRERPHIINGSKDRLSERTLMADVTDKLLSKAEEAFCSFTELMSNKVVKVISRYRIFLFKTRR